VAEGWAVTTGQFDTDDVIGPDLRVGEIRAMRTFRVSGDGDLIPLAWDDSSWADGPNTAECYLGHTPAAPRCSCGFYGHGTYLAACDYPETRDLIAVASFALFLFAGLLLRML
jgi:hypothetical protein